MQTSDIISFIFTELEEDNSDKESKEYHVCEATKNLSDKLYDLMRLFLFSWIAQCNEGAVRDKEGEKVFKRIIYRLVSSSQDIKEFVRKGEHSEEEKKAFKESSHKEARVILEEVEAFLKKGPMYFDGKMIERDDDMKKLVEESESRTVIPIIGERGMGKTTLAYRLILHWRNDFKWIEADGYSTHDQLFKEDCWIKGEEYVVVFDNLSEELMKPLVAEDTNDSFYSLFLERARSGSKIIVTSSAKGMPVNIKGFSTQECWSLFRSIAFRTWGDHHEDAVLFEDIGLKFCHQCGNNLAVLKTIADLLSSKRTTQEWQHFQDSVMTSVTSPIRTIHAIFTLMNEQMLRFTSSINKGARRCFAYGSFFSPDYGFKKGELLHLWKSLGFSTDSPEDYLEECFNNFVANDIFLEDHANTDAVMYKVSSLAYEFMKNFAEEEFILVDGSEQEDDMDLVHHLGFIVNLNTSWQAPPWLSKAKQLRSVLFFTDSSTSLDFTSIMEDFSSMKYLCALCMGVVLNESRPDPALPGKSLALFATTPEQMYDADGHVNFGGMPAL